MTDVGSRVLACTLLLCCEPSSALAFCRLTTAMPMPGTQCSEHGEVLAWRRQCIGFAVSRRNTDDIAYERLSEVVERSFASWTAVQCNGRPLGLQLEPMHTVTLCAAPEYNDDAPNVNAILFLDDWAERGLPEEAFGVTMVWHSAKTGEIYDADMQINETLGPLAICGDRCGAGEVDLQNVVTHEAGHFLGLGHSNLADATMADRAETGETQKRTLTDDDRRGLCSIYATFPPASCEPADFVPNHGPATRCGEPAVAGASCSNVAGISLASAQRARLSIAGLVAMLCCLRFRALARARRRR